MTPIESIHLSLSSIEEHLGSACEAIQAQSEAQEAMAVSVDQLKDALLELVGKVGQLYDAVSDLNGRFGSYLAEQAKAGANANILRSEVREVDRRLRLLEGGGNGQR